MDNLNFVLAPKRKNLHIRFEWMQAKKKQLILTAVSNLYIDLAHNFGHITEFLSLGFLLCENQDLLRCIVARVIRCWQIKNWDYTSVL